MVRWLDRAAPVRRAAAVAPSAGHHRTGAGRFHRQGTVAGLASGHGRRRFRARLVRRSEIHRGRRAQSLLRPGVFPTRVRALHDAGAGGHPQGRGRQHRRGQPQADLGRGLPDQGRRTRPCLCGRRAGPVDRASRYLSRAAQHRHVEAYPGAGGASRHRRHVGIAAGRAKHPGPGGADGLRADPALALDHVRRIAGAGSLCLALCRLATACDRAGSGVDVRGARRDLPGTAHGRPDPGAARRRRAHRRRRFRPAHFDQDG